ncbi:hypothetical protein HYH03_002631 [Edaphochlamys debaryana]|uniref:SBP-type domain-containing protein n=1 Tax=Edaphochlamys debaryana TaxID=47281 RepID=A0A835YBQ8_9CHLO|nr:hypothetical protein HYH03_002631 [Edaphochlamys debaryana]|eukprot:KAG2499696.1 hypothetical protein HYH03_002631 [Edaphochlamys debaryana]
MSRPNARRRTVAEAEAEEEEWVPSDWDWNPAAMSAQRSKPRMKLSELPREGTPDAEFRAETAIARTEIANPKLGNLPVYNTLKKLDDRGPLTCVVEGCDASLAGLKRYFTRLRICEAHLASPAIVVNGVVSRFCQQCGRFQPLSDFTGKKKSCAARLEIVNARHRERAAQKGQTKRPEPQPPQWQEMPPVWPAIKAEPVDVVKPLLMTAPLAATSGTPPTFASAAAVAAASDASGAAMNRCGSFGGASSAAATPSPLAAAPSAEVAPPASSPEPSGAADSGRPSWPAPMDSASSVPQAPAAAATLPAAATVAPNEPLQRVVTTGGPGLVWYSTRRWTPPPPPGSKAAGSSGPSSSAGAPASPPPALEPARPPPLPQPVYWNQVTTAIRIHTAKDGSAVATVAPPPPEEVRKALLAAEGELYQPVPARSAASAGGSAGGSADATPRAPLLAAGSSAAFIRSPALGDRECRSGDSPPHEPYPASGRRDSADAGSGSGLVARGAAGASPTVSVAGTSGCAAGSGGAAAPARSDGSAHVGLARSPGSPVSGSAGDDRSSRLRGGSVGPELHGAASRAPAVAVSQVAQRISSIMQELAPLIRQAEQITSVGGPDAGPGGPSARPVPDSVFGPAREVMARASRLASVLQQPQPPPTHIGVQSAAAAAPLPLQQLLPPPREPLPPSMSQDMGLQTVGSSAPWGPAYAPPQPGFQRHSSSVPQPPQPPPPPSTHIVVQAAPGQDAVCYMRASSASSVFIRQPLLPAGSRRAALQYMGSDAQHAPPPPQQQLQQMPSYGSYGSMQGPPQPPINGYGGPQYAPPPYSAPPPQAYGPASSAPYGQAPYGHHQPPPQPYANGNGYPYGGYSNGNGPSYGPPPPQQGGWASQAQPAQNQSYGWSSGAAQPHNGSIAQPSNMYDMLDDDAENGILFRLLEEINGEDEPGTNPGNPSNPSAYQQLCAQQSAVEACQERSRTVAQAVQQGVAVHRRGLAQMPYAAAASGAAAWPGMGPNPGSGSGAAVPMDLDRVSIKAMNMQPQELPHNLRSGMGRWLQSAGAEAVQATLRPGCLQLVVDVRRPAAASAAASLADLLIPPHDADQAATDVFRFMGQRLRDTFVQVGDQVLQIRVGEDPVVLGWEEAAEDGGLVGAKMPRIAACSAAAVCAGGEARLQLSGAHLSQPGLKVFARLRGCDVPARLLPASSSGSSSAAAPPGGAEVCVDVPAGCPGLMVVEVGLGHLLGGWWPVLVLPQGCGAAAAELASAMEPSDPAQPDGPRALDRRLVTDLGHVLDTLAAIRAAAAAAAVEAAVAAAAAAEAAAAAAAATSAGSPDASPTAGASPAAALPAATAAAAANGRSASPGSPGSQGGAGAGSTTATSAAGWSYTDTDTLASSGVGSTRLTSRTSATQHAQGAVEMPARPNAAPEPGNGAAPAAAARAADANGAAPAGQPALAPRAPRPAASAAAPSASVVRQALARAARLLLFTVARGLPHLTELLLDAAARLAAALPRPEPSQALAATTTSSAASAAAGPLAAAGLLPQALLPLAVLSGCARVVDALAAFADDVLGEPLRLDLPQGPAGMTLLHLAAVMDDGGAMASHLVASQPWAAWSWLCLRWAPPMLEPPPRTTPPTTTAAAEANGSNQAEANGHANGNGPVVEEPDGVAEAEADAVRLTPGALSLLLGQAAPQRKALGMLVMDAEAQVVVGERSEAEEAAALEAARAGQVAEAAEGVVEAWGRLSASLLEALCGQLAGQQL